MILAIDILDRCGLHVVNEDKGETLYVVGACMLIALQVEWVAMCNFIKAT